MSCEVRLTACLQNIPTIRRCLFPTDDKRGSDNWLQLCQISASPTGDIIVIGNERRLVVLAAKWDSVSSLSHFQISYADSIHKYDKVKAVLCLPIVGQSHSTHVGPDWTCILIGYDSGYIRFYTEKCELLIEEQLHSENISSIKCQSQHSPRPDISPDLHPEEIYVQYQSNICVLNGAQLFTNLRNGRSELAKVQAKGDKGGLDIQLPPLNPKKWGFNDQAVINDATVVGLNLSSTFNHLLTASTFGGFDTKYRAMAPHNTLVLAAGSKPFLGFHYASEGVNQPVLSDVAKAVASKLKSALPGWLTGNKSQQEKQVSVAMQPVEMMGCRFGLCDLRRTASSTVLCQNRQFAAVTDTLGRVLLIDCFKGVTLRIFKGYREAQCSFVQVPDERKSKHRLGNKIAHFLVIYSPKKGTIEIFSVQQGARVATFSASKYSRLLHISYGLMGFTTMSKSRYICQYTTIFIDNDGQIKEFLVPFHFSLAEKNNKRARDIHLYKKLRHLIKCGETNLEQLLDHSYNTCSELKTLEVKAQTVEMLLNSKEVPTDATLKCIEYFCNNSIEGPDNEVNKFKLLCENARLLLLLYNFAINGSKPDLDNENSTLEISDNLNMKSEELKHLQKLLDLTTVNIKNYLKEVHVSFSDKSSFTASDFLTAFDLTTSDRIALKLNLEENTVYKTSEVLFKPYITGVATNFEDLGSILHDSKLSIKDLFFLAISYWVNRSLDINLNLEKEMSNFSLLIGALVNTASKNITDIEYGSISEFWLEIREMLVNSARPFPALMAAILCRSWAQNEEKLESSTTSLEEENIEMLSQENIQWALLIGKLEDVSMLNIILSGKALVANPLLPKLNHNKIDISLKHILQKGRGSVSELVAQWLTTSGIDPKNIVINDIVYKNSSKNEDNNSKDKSSTKKDNNLEPPIPNAEEQICEGMHLENIEQVKSEPIFEYINLLKIQFPYSLDGSTLLANMCWEYALAWQKDITALENLEAAIKCLSCIGDVNIKHGIHHLLWNTHLKIVIESSCKLINKVGKLPKERLCKQDTGLSDKEISSFLGICTEFLESFMDIVQLSSHAPKTVLQFEAIWETSSQPLVELALQQKEIDYNVLFLHYQLSLVLHMITTFSVKHSKPVNNLFEASVANLFFTNLQGKVDININKSDLKVHSSRTQFLCKIISASLESVIVNENGDIYCTDHVNWVAKCLILARIWNLDVDMLKRFQIVQLYCNGFDAIAEELIPAVNSVNELGAELLVVTARRLKQYLSSSPDLSQNIAALSPALSRYLDTLEGEWTTPSPLKSITNLATHTFRCLNEDQNDHTLATLLLEACSNLEEINS